MIARIYLNKNIFCRFVMISITQWRARIGCLRHGRCHDYLNAQCGCTKCLWKLERRPSDSRARDDRSRKDDKEGDKMATSMEKKTVEPDMVMLHLQQNIDIPEISLVVHPTVATVIKKCADDGSKAKVVLLLCITKSNLIKVADFGDSLEYITFLDALQTQVIITDIITALSEISLLT